MGTIAKAIEVLFHLHEVGSPRGVTAIGRELGMPRSSVHRLLAPLLARGLVERDGEGHYRPGMGLVALGLGVLEREPVVTASRPVLERFADELGETFFLVGARAGELVVLEKAEGRGFLRAAPQVGARVPVHATAAGKLYLAFAPEEVPPPGSEEAPSYTERTLTDRVALAAESARALENGLAWNRDEWIPGLSVIAAPIRAGQRMLAALALALPSSRLESLGENLLCERIRAAADEISRRLSGPLPGAPGGKSGVSA
jgi:DNA-binding IclR family transcriptional regulator